MNRKKTTRAMATGKQQKTRISVGKAMIVPAIAFLIGGCRTAVIFTASEPDAKIFVDGRQIRTGTAPEIIKVPSNSCVSVRIEKTGFLTENFSYCYDRNNLFQPETKYTELSHDDAFDASVKDDYANKDFEQEISTKYSEAEAWKIISQVVTSYFDNLEMADKETGYMKTNWHCRSFKQKTVRTRIIVRQSSTIPLKYKLKIVSAFSDKPEQSVKDDDKFREWDRILKKYEGIISEFQSRLGAK